jgi:hypothetical protein
MNKEKTALLLPKGSNVERNRGNCTIFLLFQREATNHVSPEGRAFEARDDFCIVRSRMLNVMQEEDVRG